MSFEAISTITKAEEDAKVCRDNAEAKAKELIAEAENAGKAALDAAKEKAAAELKEYQIEADAKAKSQADELSASTESKQEALRAGAEKRIDKAAKTCRGKDSEQLNGHRENEKTASDGCSLSEGRVARGSPAHGMRSGRGA